jgi:hypothetical protein
MPIRMKRDRPKGTFYGNDQGRWGYDEGYPLDILQRWDWKASIGLSSTNGWRNLAVDGATEDNRGFRKALREIVREYPEVADYVVSFDGPFQPVSRLVGGPVKAPGSEVDLGRITFFHGTSDDVLDEILLHGLKPRGATNVEPTYGVEVGASPSRAEAVYLTTQMGLATAAANSAARKRGGKPVILEITGLSHDLFQPDEDSGESDAVSSLERMGSVAYVGSIRPDKIRVRWDKMASAARVASRYARYEDPKDVKPGMRTVKNAVFYWSTDRPVPIGFRVPKARPRKAEVEEAFERVRKQVRPEAPSRLDTIFVCPVKKQGFCRGGWSGPYVYKVRVTGKTFTTDGGFFTEAIFRPGSAESWADGYWQPERLPSLVMNRAEETLVDGSVVVEKLVISPDMKTAGTRRFPVRLTCDYRGDFFLMDLRDDLFIHFTPPERAEQILADGKLLMRPPYKKFGIDAVTAVSAVWGMWLPAVQTTHSKRDDMVAIAFRTNTVPKYGHPEEVVWDQDVVLRDARILPFSKAKAMLQSADDGKEKQVYYQVPSWCEAPR